MAKVVKKCIVPGVLQVDSGRTKRRVDTETAWKAHRCISCVLRSREERIEQERKQNEKLQRVRE